MLQGIVPVGEEPHPYHLAGKNHLLELDRTLHEVMNLDDGQQAERSCVGGAWARRDIED
jgi:hypothetical protein